MPCCSQLPGYYGLLRRLGVMRTVAVSLDAGRRGVLIRDGGCLATRVGAGASSVSVSPLGNVTVSWALRRVRGLQVGHRI